MTTLSAIAGISSTSAPVSGPAKGNTSEAGFHAAFDSAAASLASPSGTAQPGKSDKGPKPAEKEEDASPAKHGDSSQASDGLLSLLVAPPAPAPAELASNNLPVQEAADTPAVASADTAESGRAALPEAGMDSASSVPADFSAGVSADIRGGAHSAGTLPPIPTAEDAQKKLAPTFQSPQPEAPKGSPSTPSLYVLSAKNAAQPAPAWQISDIAPSIPAQLQAADPSTSNATAQAWSQTAGPPSPVPARAGAGKAQPGGASLQSAPALHKTEPGAHLSSGALTQERGNQQKSDSSPRKEGSAGPTAPATPSSVQGPAANTTAVMSSLAVPGIVSGANVAHEASSGPSISGALATSQATAAHPPEVNASAAALPQINTARVLGSMNGTELRVGMHSQEFGSVSIATSVSPGGVAAQIALDHGALSRALAAHLPGMEEKLGHALGVQARVEVLSAGTGAGYGGSAPREGAASRGERGLPSTPAAQNVSASESVFAQTPLEALEQTASGLRLSVRA